jgi:hypothetical protein
MPASGSGRGRLLLGLIDGEEPDELTIMLRCELIERESRCAPADCTPEVSRRLTSFA